MAGSYIGSKATLAASLLVAADGVVVIDASAGDVRIVPWDGFYALFAPASAALPVADTTAVVKGSDDATKLVRIEADGLTTGTTRVLTVPDADITLAGINLAQTFTAVQTFQAAASGVSNPIRSRLPDSTDVFSLEVNAAASAASRYVIMRLHEPITGTAKATFSWDAMLGAVYISAQGSADDVYLSAGSASGNLIFSAFAGNYFFSGAGVTTVGTNAVGVLVVTNGTAPTTYPADLSQQWVADISALNAAWHWAGEGLVAGVMQGGLTIRQKAGVAGTDEGRLSHNGTSFLLGVPGFASLLQLGPSDLNRVYVGTTWFTDEAFYWMLRMGSVDGTVNVRSDGSYGWSSTGNSYDASDTTLYRAAAGVVRAGTTSSSGLGWIQNTAGESRVTSNLTNTTVTLANITGLSATLLAGRKYAGELVLYCSETTAADGLGLDFDGGTATMTSFIAQGFLSDDTSVRRLPNRVTALATDMVEATITGNTVVTLKFFIVVNAAGTFIPRFSKAADAAGAALTLSANSYMSIRDVP